MTPTIKTAQIARSDGWWELPPDRRRSGRFEPQARSSGKRGRLVASDARRERFRDNALLDARVPRPAVRKVALRPAIVELVRDDDAVQVLEPLVPELTFHAEPQRRAVLQRQIRA